MIYRLLGELEVGDGSNVLRLPNTRTLTLLAALLVNANCRVPRAELIRAAWGEDDFRGHIGQTQLPKQVMLIRSALAKIGRRDDLMAHSGFGYEIRVNEDAVDTLLFRRLVRDAGIEDSLDGQVSVLRSALRLWRGPHPLSNVPSDAFRQDTLALEQQFKRVGSRLFSLELARGNHDRILNEGESPRRLLPL